MNEAEKILRDLGRKIDDLIDRAKSGEIKEDMDEMIESLKKQRDKFEEKVKDMKEKNDPKIQEAKTHLRKAMEEMNQAFHKMFRKGPSAEVMDDDD